MKSKRSRGGSPSSLVQISHFITNIDNEICEVALWDTPKSTKWVSKEHHIQQNMNFWLFCGCTKNKKNAMLQKSKTKKWQCILHTRCEYNKRWICYVVNLTCFHGTSLDAGQSILRENAFREGTAERLRMGKGAYFFCQTCASPDYPICCAKELEQIPLYRR